MLDPAREGRSREHGAAATSPATAERFAFGGVEIELRRGSGLPPAETSAFTLPPGEARTAGRVTCTARLDPASIRTSQDPPNALVATRTRDRVVLRSRALQAEIFALGDGRYEADARIAAGPAAMAALVRGLAAAVLRLEGGATLHAAAAEISGRAVAYLGPSGAGKSTALRLTAGGRGFADDHVALVPSPHGWSAWRLPGGSPSGVPVTSAVVLPLAALLRVRRGRSAPAVDPLLGIDALFAVREAIESDDGSVDAEAARLDVAERIAREVRVATVHTVLGRSIGELVATWLEGHRPSATAGSAAS